MESGISNRSVAVALKNQIFTDLDGEVVILNLKTGIYYGLNGVGSSIWYLIQHPKAISEIKDALIAQYKVEPDQCEKDLLALLDTLQDEGLVEIKDDSAV
jgi:hypothetical protein